MSAVPPVRPDLALAEGYHSPQVEAEVRLNTNESPYEPPEAWRAELLAALAEVPFHRYPDRPATELRAALADHHGVTPEEVFCANGSNEVLQCLLLAFGGPGRRALVFEPTYALHSHIARITATEVVQGERDDGFLIEPGDAAAVIAAARPKVTFVCSPNNPTGRAEPPATVAAICAVAPGLVVVDEAYGQFSPFSALDLRGPAHPGLVVTRTFSKTWALAGARLGYLVADPAVVAACEAVVLPYHLSVQTQLAGQLALRHAPEMVERVARIAEQRGRVAAALAGLRVDTWPSDANFILFRPRARRRRGVAVPAGSLGADPQLRGLGRLARLPACQHRDARGERSVPARPGGEPVTTRTRSASKERVTKETKIDATLVLEGTGRTEVATGLPFFDHMVEQLGRHAGFDLTVHATGDLHVDAHHTVEDVGIVLGGCLAEALGDKAGIRRFASILLPLDEALVEVALDLSGRPFLAYKVEFAPDTPGLGTPPFDPQLAEEFWRAFATAANITLHVRRLEGKNTHHVLEASFKGVARCLRDAVRVEGGGVPSTKGSL